MGVIGNGGRDRFWKAVLNDMRERLQAHVEEWKTRYETARLAHEEGRVEIERLTAALQQIDQWSRAYPLAVFPEPDFAAAAALLRANNMSLDAISASNMRHVVEGVGKIARAALEGKP